MRDVLIPFPTLWDQPQLQACRPDWGSRFCPHLLSPPDAEVHWLFDLEAFVQAQVAGWRGRAAGVFSSSDYPGAVAAAAIAQALGLAGPGAASVLRATHKYRARQAMQSVAPVRHALIDPDAIVAPDIGFPCFVKPVKGTYSMFTRRVEDLAELRSFLQSANVQEYRHQFLAIFNRTWRKHTGDAVDGRYFLAEEPLGGAQVTVEGMIARGQVTIFGVVDSEFAPGSSSFSRFVYPSRLPPEPQRTLTDTATAAVLALGIDNTLFNLELFWHPQRGAQVIEFNPRMCGQFADLYQRVDGKNSYVAAMELACGLEPMWPRGQGKSAIAASVPLRVFEPVEVTAAPTPAQLLELAERFSDALIWSEVCPGMKLDELHLEDGASTRYAVINLGAATEAELQDSTRAIGAALGFQFQPLR